MSDDAENAWNDGNRAAWATMLAECLRQLGYDNTDVARARWITEREGAIRVLRSICRDYGDNDWPDDLNLTDVISKHLEDHLRQP